MRKSALLLVLGAVCLSAAPVAAAKLTSSVVVFGNSVARVSCGVTYRGNPETTVRVEIFNFAVSLLDEELVLSPEFPAGWWRTTACPDAGCGGPWCRVTTTPPKGQFRATLCVESDDDDDDDDDFSPLACIPVE